METDELITGDDVDDLFRWLPGRAERMARKGKLPSLTLADGSIRFERAAIMATVKPTITDEDETPEQTLRRVGAVNVA